MVPAVSHFVLLHFIGEKGKQFFLGFLCLFSFMLNQSDPVQISIYGVGAGSGQRCVQGFPFSQKMQGLFREAALFQLLLNFRQPVLYVIAFFPISAVHLMQIFFAAAVKIAGVHRI